MTKVFIDIETIPTQPEMETKAEIAKTISAPAIMSKPETIQDWHDGIGKYIGAKDAAINAKYRESSIDGSRGELFSIAFGTREEDVVADWRAPGEREDDLLDSVFTAIAKITSNHGSQTAPFFIGHYLGGFDLKFLYQRAIILKVKPPFAIPFSGRHDKDFYCTMQAWAGYGGKISQDNLCKALGIPGKTSDVKGSNVWDYVKAGKYAEVVEYNKDDVRENIAIYNRLNFI